MQQATGLMGSSVSAVGNAIAPAAVAGSAAAVSYVINLCASTSPAGLEQPKDPALKQFRFFVSRRREDGRERFRLHMGYFPSQEAAERMLAVVRDVYPAAWAGAAPGQKLRARAAADTAATQTQTMVAPAIPFVPLPAAAPARIAIPAAPLPPAVKLELVPDAPRVAPAAAEDSAAASRSLSNVRAAIDSLGDAPRASAPRTGAPGLEAKAVLRLLESARLAPASRVAPRAPAAPQIQPTAHTQPASPAPPARHTQPAARTQPPPRATAAPRAPLAPASEPVAYAVQLRWSVQAIDLSKVPQLAIFAAYTLYGVEGNRDGRRWYGLRLGFFTDAVSAKQVAQYVRSEFNAVSIVPVTGRERERATAAMARQLPAHNAAKPTGPELNFIENVPTDTATSGIRPGLPPTEPAAPAARPAAAAAKAAPAAVPPPGAKPARSAPGKRTKLRVAQGTKPVSKRVRQSGPPLSLEETLEILGAGELQMDAGRGELMNDESKHERKRAPRRSSRFGRLISRLAERLNEDRSG
jgi:hypothetical protein